jgi:hypothetical protein
MALSQALKTNGVEFQRGDGATTEVFTTVGEVVDFDGPGGEAAEIECTHLLSDAVEVMVGLPDEGNFTINCNLVPGDTAQTGLRTDRDNGTRRNFKLKLSDLDGGVSPTTLAFAAYVKGFKINGQANGKIAASVTLRVSGPVTWTARVAA